MDKVFVRQAIFNKKNDVEFYELIFGEIDERNEANKEIDEKRIKSICNYGTIGLKAFTNNKMAFVNFTTKSLIEDIPELLGKENIIIQISNKIDFTDEVITFLKDYKKRGFLIVYDSISLKDDIKLLADIVDIYKINFYGNDKGSILNVISEVRRYTKKYSLMAASLKCEEEYNFALKNNFDYFEGEFFSKPTEIKNEDIAVRNSNRFNIIVELINDDFDVDRVEYIIKSDLSISYKLIRFLNSSVFGFVQRINSIKQAIMLLGKDELKKWLTLVVVSEMKVNENEELINNTIIRGRFCELVAKNICSNKRSFAFMVGLFSELDLFMNKSMKELVEEMQLEKDIKKALIGENNILKTILDLVKSYEKMDVKMVEKYSNELNIDKMILFQLYSESIDWLNETKVNFNK